MSPLNLMEVRMKSLTWWTLFALACADGGKDTTADDTDAATDDTVPEDTVLNTPDTSAASCDAPGTPTTPTPVASADPSAMNVTALACTRTAVALACDVGEEHHYQESSDGTTRTITANGIVDHDVGAFPNDGNPNTISAQTYTYSVPVTPSGAGEARQGVFGILFSGSVLDPGTAETWNDDATWRYEALRYATATAYFGANGGTDETFHPDGLGVDCNLAHVQPTGAYHYHGLPTSLVPDAPAVTQVGWAADGYPVVVLYGHDDPDNTSSAVRALTSSYRVKSGQRPANSPGGAYDGTFGADWEYAAGTGDLDDCNGRVDTVTIDGVPTKTYAYFLTDTFPYIPRCYKAAPDASFAQLGGGGGGGGGAPGGGAIPECTPGQTERCCGDGTCDGPETADNCPADCR